MTPIRILSGLFLACILSTPSAGHEPIRISAALNFDGAPGNDAQGEEADATYDTLGRHAGRIIFLDLTVRPNKNDGSEPGYQIKRLGPAKPDSAEAPICGETLGMLDNTMTMFSVGIGHPSHFHASMEILVGDRLAFPHQEITCSTEGYTDGPRTPLILRGYFSVQEASIPTAFEYRLTPANP